MSTTTIPKHATLASEAPETATCKYCGVEKDVNPENWNTFSKGVAYYLRSRCASCESEYRGKLKTARAAGEHIAKPRAGRSKVELVEVGDRTFTRAIKPPKAAKKSGKKAPKVKQAPAASFVAADLAAANMPKASPAPAPKATRRSRKA